MLKHAEMLGHILTAFARLTSVFIVSKPVCVRDYSHKDTFFQTMENTLGAAFLSGRRKSSFGVNQTIINSFFAFLNSVAMYST